MISHNVTIVMIWYTISIHHWYCKLVFTQNYAIAHILGTTSMKFIDIEEIYSIPIRKLPAVPILNNFYFYCWWYSLIITLDHFILIILQRWVSILICPNWIIYVCFQLLESNSYSFLQAEDSVIICLTT